jgi:parallel beta-helix repeat protein
MLNRTKVFSLTMVALLVLTLVSGASFGYAQDRPATSAAPAEPPSILSDADAAEPHSGDFSAPLNEKGSVAAPSAPSEETREQQARDAYANLPLYFIKNQGQHDERVAYYAQQGGANVYFTDEEMVMALPETVLRLCFVDANPDVQITGARKQKARFSYFIGNDPDEWRTEIPSYGGIAYRDLYPGVDLTYSGRNGVLKYEFALQPGADVEAIRLAYAGADEVRLAENGDLLITPEGTHGETPLRDAAPYVYQEIDGARMEVDAAFILYDTDAYGFAVGDYDPRYPLVIDPQLRYSTFLGESSDDWGYVIALDSVGNAYVTGETSFGDFPTTAGAYDTKYNGSFDIFVSILDPTLSRLSHSTFLGGSGWDYSGDIALDGDGNAYVMGETLSDDFPTTDGAYDTSYNGEGYYEVYHDVFVSVLDPTLSSLSHSTFLGGSDRDYGCAIALDDTGSAYVTGETWSSDFPTIAGGYDTSHNGSPDIFVSVLDPTLSSLSYSTFLGGSDWDYSNAIALDSDGNAYVTGETPSSNFPTTTGAYDTSRSEERRVVVSVLDPTLSNLSYSTFLGGRDWDYSNAIALDGDGNAYVTGETSSGDFPTTAGAYDEIYNGGYCDVFVSMLDSTLSNLSYSTFLGESNDDRGQSIALDDVDNIYVAGYTSSSDFPTTAGAYDTSYGASEDIFVSVLNPASGGSSDLLYSTFLGESDDEGGTTTRVSVASDGTEGDDLSSTPSISADGRYVAFESNSTNLVNNETEGEWNVFVHDRQTGKTSRITLSSEGTHGHRPSISASGRYVAFASIASDLVAGDANGKWDVFVHDRDADGDGIFDEPGATDTVRVSVDSDGNEGEGNSEAPSISGDGRYVAFKSDASDLADECVGGHRNVFVHDRDTDGDDIFDEPGAIDTICASVTPDGSEGNGHSKTPSISADGNYVAFRSEASDLVGVDANGECDIFVRDMETEQTTLVSVASDGDQGNGASYSPSISANGDYVAFYSHASDLVDGDTNECTRNPDGHCPDVFVHDRQTGDTTRVSVSSDGSQGDAESYSPSISADGRRVAFYSYASNLVEGDTNDFCNVDYDGYDDNCPDVFIHDLETEKTIRASVSSEGIEGNSWSWWASISSNGSCVAFVSSADNLVDNDNNDKDDIFVHDQEDIVDPDLELAKRFAPYMYFHEDDIYRPITVTIPLKYGMLSNDVKEIYSVSPTLTDLTTPEWNDSDTYIDLFGDGPKVIRKYYERDIRPWVEPLAFARVVTDSDDIAIQYWFYYYDNDWSNHHEGDWEMIQVVLDSDETPKYAAYSQHREHFGFSGPTRRLWEYVETIPKDGPKDGEWHPVVYVARGSHANYFEQGDHFQCIGYDVTGIELLKPVPFRDNPVPIKMFPDPPEDTWVYFQGYWGAKGSVLKAGDDGPPSPSQHEDESGYSWEYPITWSEGLPWDETMSHNAMGKINGSIPAPFDVHLYKLPGGEHVGWKGSQVENEIPDNAEYFDNPISEQRTVILHDVESFTRYLVKLTYRPSTSQLAALRTTDDVTFTLRLPDLEASTIITSIYHLSQTWNLSTTGAISIYHGNDLHLRVDIDGDGAFDQDIPPTTMDETPFDFTAPAPITDLEILTATTETVTLTWTAPGDDEYTGTVSAYDIRYYTDPITDANWVSATLIISPPVPSAAGTTEVFTITEIPCGRHYLAIQAVDDVLHYSELSNVVRVDIPCYLYLPLVLRNYEPLQPLQAGFVATPTIGTVPLTVTFTNESSSVYTSSLWDFGDSFTSTMENPTHVYTTTGAYTVTLTISGTGGTDTLTRSNYITVSTPITGLRYVAPDGADTGNDCTDSTAPCATVQHAVDASAPGDEIRVASGTYTDLHARSRNDITTTGVVTQVVYVSKTVSIRGGYTTTNWTTPDTDINTTTLDAQGQGRVLYVTGNISVAVEGLQITGGDSTGLGGPYSLWNDGGGAYVISATVTFRNNRVFDNIGDNAGGGLHLRSAHAVFSGNSVLSNTARYNGGGIFLWGGQATLTENTISNNAISDFGSDLRTRSPYAPLGGGAVCGGGIFLGGETTLTGNTITGNTADWDGGGVCSYYDASTLKDNLIADNTAGRRGGGMYMTDDVTMTGNIITGNTADGDGGGLALSGGSYAEPADVLLTNNVVANNRTSGDGSGVYVVGPANLVHTTIVSNSGGDSGIHVARYAKGTVALTNTILVSHSVGISVTEGNTVTINGILWHKTPITISQATTATVTVQNQHVGDPVFAPDGYHLMADSAAIDRGVDTDVTTDVDGDIRPQGANPDLGADEYVAEARMRRDRSALLLTLLGLPQRP